MKKLMITTLLIASFFVITSAGAEDVFSCHGNVGFLKLKKEKERGAIYPRNDIILTVDSESEAVLCRFNDAAIKVEDVFFRGIDNSVLTHDVVNSSTIQVKISHTDAVKYRLQCVLKRPKGDKVLCRQYVKAGYPPMDIVKDSLHCISKNYESLNCTWRYQNTPITTIYKPQYSIPKFYHETPCFTNDDKNMCFWRTTENIPRDKLYLHLHGSNVLGKREYTHQINVPEVVIPNKIFTIVTLTGPKTAKVVWNLSFPIDVFSAGLWHKVDYRLAGNKSWDIVKLISHKHPVSRMRVKREFHVTKALPLANMNYEFRVRLHTMAAPIEKDLWSDFNTISVHTEAMLPSTSPKTDLSSFEVVEYLDRRDIYVNFQDIEENLHSGNDFKYKVVAYSPSSDMPLKIEATDISRAYLKYPMMDFNETRFKIWPENEKGVGKTFSEVIVPSYVCMPKKTDFFTVIIRNGNSSDDGSKDNKMFSLYWVPSKKAEEHCPGGSFDIDFYTIFWCKKTYGERCKEKLFWIDVTKPRLVPQGLSSNSTLYEKNITGLADGLYTFGVAAVSGKYSSGIRWSRCIVDESDSPPAPSNVNAYAENSSTVRIKWELKCSSLSAVPLGFKILYCKSEISDFGHCTSQVSSTILSQPDAKSHTLTRGLQPGVSYIFSVSLLSYIGEGKQSIPVIFKMKEKKPTGAPTSFRLESVSNSTAILSWRKPATFRRNGNITHYCLYPNDVFGASNCIPATKNEEQIYHLENLSPFKKYGIWIIACTKEGCGGDFRSTINFVTKPSRPDPVRNFVLDVNNWRLEWEPGMCNSRKCTFDLQIHVNDSFIYEETVEGFHYFSLYDLDLPCSKQNMTFSIRSIGMSEDNRSIYGEWTSATKAANECPPVSPPLWVIALIVSIGFFICAFVWLIFKFGWRSVMKAIKACTMKIEVPKGILEDTIKDKKNDHKKEAKYLKAKRDTLLKLPQKNSSLILPVDPKDSVPQEDKAWTKSPRNSVSSEEIQLIPPNGENHGRNLSGSSDHSSNQDSAVMSQSSSTAEPDSPSSHNALPRIISDFTYVQHGILPDKIPEGYVAARSVPSLPALLKTGDTDILQSTPNLNSTAAVIIMEGVGARRASTGYISMVNSENGKVSPSQIDGVMFTPNNSSVSPYIKHGMFPTQDSKPSVTGYVTLAQAPHMFDSNNSYIPPEAYCKVADRNVPQIDDELEEEKTSSNPYVAVGDQAFMFGNSQHIPAYVQLTDANRWTAPVPQRNLTPEKVTNEKVFINQITPSLSKQSSGYVSQEAIMQENQSDQVVMSPKRLAVNGKRPQAAIFHISTQQSSMV